MDSRKDDDLLAISVCSIGKGRPCHLKLYKSHILIGPGPGPACLDVIHDYGCFRGQCHVGPQKTGSVG